MTTKEEQEVHSTLVQSLFLSLSHEKEHRLKGNKGIADLKQYSFGKKVTEDGKAIGPSDLVI